MLTAAALLLQTALIIGLFYEHRRRRVAEMEAGHRMAELAHLNRAATVGELSASIAHELTQPLAAMAANSSAALRWLAKATPIPISARHEPPSTASSMTVTERIS
jgi:phosphoglycerate-specific signal transduction histidine kinase